MADKVDGHELDVTLMVVVPAAPGPLRPLADANDQRDEVDELLDDVFGQPDAGGAGPLDAALLIGGATAVIAGLTSIAPTAVLVVGLIAFCLGAVLPLRSAWRAVLAARRTRRLESMIGDGVLMSIDHPSLVALVAAYDRCTEAQVTSTGVAATAAAHAVIIEVATLLGGGRPSDPADVRYVTERAEALDELATALNASSSADVDRARRAAVVQARAEVDRIDGRSALTDAAVLARQLREAR